MLSLSQFRLSVASDSLTAWPANRLRGALGNALRKVCCPAPRRECCDCASLGVCAYAYLYETQAVVESKFHGVGQEVPRPYVVRDPVPAADSSEVVFELVLIGKATALLPYLVLAADEWAKECPGAGNGQGRLTGVRGIHPFSGETHEVFSPDARTIDPPRWEVSLEGLARGSQGDGAGRLRVKFVTPTRLKHRGKELHRPEFGALIAGLARRIEALQLYHEFPAVVPDGYRDLVADSGGVRLVEWDGEDQARERYSYRQHRQMRMEGMVGRAVYEGKVGPCMPLVRLGELIHVGKGAVFGLGRYEIEVG